MAKSNGRIAADGDRMDNTTPANAGGVTDASLAELQAAADAIGESIKTLSASIATADQAVNQAASWAAVLEKVAGLVERFVPAIGAKATSAVGGQPSVKRLVVNGLVGAMQAPAAQRGPMLLDLVNRLMGTTAES